MALGLVMGHIKMENLIKQSQERIDAIEKLFGEIEELQQNRSNYTLGKFVVGQHDMPARQRKQVLDELLSLLEGLNQCVSMFENTQIDIEELQEPVEDKYQQRRNEIKLREKELDLRFLKFRMIGLIRECDYLYGLLDKMPKYTREEFEKEEAQYWEKRLTRQARLTEMFGGNFGNVDAILQMYSEPGRSHFSMPVKSKDFLRATVGYDRLIEEGEHDRKNDLHLEH